MFWPHSLTQSTQLVVSFQDVKVTQSLCMSGLVKVLSLSSLYPASSCLLCLIRVSGKHHCIQHQISSSSLPHPSLSMPNSCPPSSPVFFHLCLHERITSWVCGEDGLKPQTKHWGFNLVLQCGFGISHQLQLEYESMMVVLQLLIFSLAWCFCFQILILVSYTGYFPLFRSLDSNWMWWMYLC